MQRIVFLSFFFTVLLFSSNPFDALEFKNHDFLSMIQKDRQKYLAEEEAKALCLKKIQKKKQRLAKIQSIKEELKALERKKKETLKLLVEAKKEEARKKKVALEKQKREKLRKAQIAKSKHLYAKIDISQQRMKVYRGDVLLHKWKISSGKKGHATPRGKYKAQWTSKNYRSRKYNNASMPYSVFFRNGYAIHGTRSVKRLGRRASHGCIRLRTSNAKKFYALVQKSGKINTSIHIN